MHAIPSRPGFWWGGLTCFGLAAAAFYMVLHAPRSTLPTISPTAAQPTLVVPLAFERNLGQSDPAVDFVSRGRGYTLFVTPREAVLRVRETATPIRLRWVDASASAQFGADTPLSGERHVLHGADPAAWRRHIPAYARVRYAQLYPGIDLVYYGARGDLEYDWVLAPGADPAQIRMAVTGVDRVAIDGQGALQLRTAGHALSLPAPVIYQDTLAGRQRIAGGYLLHPGNQVGFWLGDYDAKSPLVIDPVLVYGSYLGGAGAERVGRVAVDGGGNVYLTGETASSDFPVSGGAAQGVSGGGSDAFVAKFDSAGALVYVTYLGGAGSDRGTALAVDGGGATYVTGTTESLDFPLQNAEQPSYGGIADAFVAKLSADGASLVYSTYLGGNAQESANAIVVDGSGAAYVAGGTLSPNFPVSAGAVQSSFQSIANDQGVIEADGYIAKLSADGASLVYSTYLGGSDGESVFDIALATGGELVAVGGTKSVNFPLTAPNVRGVFGGFPEDGFVTRLSADGSTLRYSTFFGGNAWDSAQAVAVDGSGNIYVAGVTASSDFPITSGAAQTRYGGGRSDGFVAKLNSAGDTVLYGTYLGGSDVDQVNGITLAADDGVLVAGETSSADFPLTRALQSSCLGNQDAFLARINPAGTAFDWSSYWGGSGDDSAGAVARDGAGRIYFAGTSASNDFPVFNGAQMQTGGGSDAFLLGLDDGAQSADVYLTLRDREDPTPLTADVIYDITVGNNGPDAAPGVNVRTDLAESYNFVSATPTQGICTTAATIVSCDVGTIATGNAVQITFALRARQGGSNTFSASVQRTRLSDADLSNNSAREETTVTVGNGGGSFAPSGLAMLTVVYLMRRRRR